MGIGIKNMYMMMLCDGYRYSKAKRVDICEKWVKQLIEGPGESLFTTLYF
jgi:hypothetical protein